MVASPAPVLVQIRDLSFAYPGGAGEVLRIPFLDISGRGLIALTGPSGAGKSTLVELMAGTLREPYGGSLKVLGEEWGLLTADAQRQRHLRRIGLIPQDYGLLTDRTPRQMLLRDLADAQVRPAERAQRVVAALAQVQMAPFADRVIAGLSGGQRQRVAIARMLARDVELVIADEPTANLDRDLTVQTMSVLRTLAATVPVLVVTHEPEVAAACDRTIVLQTLARPTTPVARAGTGRRRHVWVLGLVAVAALILVAAGARVWARQSHHAARQVAASSQSAAASRGNVPRETGPSRAPASAGPTPIAAPAPPAEPAPARPPTMTATRLFTPFGIDGKPVIHLETSMVGSCWTSSISLSDPHAYRCTSGNEVLDPCFSSPGQATYVICVGAPWDNGIRLRLTKPVPVSPVSTSPPVAGWAVLLSNGAECVASDGAPDTVAGVAMGYFCTGGGEAGDLRRSSQPWTIDYLPPHSPIVQPVPVRTAWG